MNPDRRDSDDGREDAELLELVAGRARDPARAREAEGVLYARHVRYLYGVLLRHKKNLLSLAGIGAEDLVQETFHRAFERAHTFERGDAQSASRHPGLRPGEPGSAPAPVPQRQRTRAWLGRIATNLLTDHLNRLREVPATPYLERVVCEGIDEEPPSSRSPAVRRVSEALEQLTERERDVLRVSALHYRAGDHQRLSNAASAELASRWGTTNDNVRAIRARAMKKLKALLLAQDAEKGEAS